MLERHYSQCCLMWSSNDSAYGDISEEISIETFLRSFIGFLIGKMHEFK